MVNILILNFTSKLNKGAAALLNCKVKLFNKYLSHTKFIVSTYNPNIKYYRSDIKLIPVHGKYSSFKNIFGELIISIMCIIYTSLNNYIHLDMNILIKGKNLEQYSIQKNPETRIKEALYALSSLFLLFRCASWAILNKVGIHINRSFCGNKLKEYYEADIILNTGGDVLTEDYSFPYSYFMNLLFGILLDKSVVICAESIGPFKKGWSQYIARYVLNRVTLITLRESISLKNLQDIGVNIPPIYVTADLAFLLEPPSKSITEELFIKEGINTEKILIGFSVSKIISRYGFIKFSTSVEKYDEYIKLMSQCMDYSIEMFNATVVIVPHVIGPGDNDDRSVADDIYKWIKNKDKIVSIKEDYTPEELKGIIGQCDMFIGSRMHATIASTSMLVPTIGIAYSHKMNGIVGEMLGQEKYILDIKHLDYENLILTIDDVWKNRDIIREELKIKIPIAKEKAMFNGTLIRELIDPL